MKYMLMMHAPRAGWKEAGIGTWPMEDIKAHISFMGRFNEELTRAGEFVDAQGLALPEEARVVRAGKSGAPEVTDGPFAEAKEFLAGFWIIDCESHDRAYEIAARASAAPGKGGVPLNMPIEVRQVMCAPASGHVTAASLDYSGENLLRELAPKVLGAVVRRFGDFAAAEDAVQEALLAAALQWPEEGVPDNPRGWLIQVAARRMTDHLRADLARRRRETIVVMEAPASTPARTDVGSSFGAGAAADIDQDDTLILLFMCCHSALTRPSAIALTLRAVGGLTTAEIANAFLVPEATMAQRISRAKQRIKTSGVPFRMPTDGERAERLDAVLHVLYLIFNEGYTSSIGPDLHRSDLSNEAIRLTRAVHNLLPHDGEIAGLLALMLLTDARRPARTGPEGDLIPLAEQDRALWDLRAITEGVALITATLSRGSIGAYQLQAAVAAVHDEAARAEDTDWPQILALYGLLKRMSDNPMVTLNHAIAAAMVQGPPAGLKLLEALDGDERLAGHYRLDAVRAHLFEMAGNHEAAIAHYLSAAGRTTSIPERNYLSTRAARLSAEGK